jgi:sulfate transport system substrate-binding protein
VHIARETEALLAVNETSGKFQNVNPSLSIVAEPRVAVVERIAKRRGTTEIARAYLEYHYSPVGQEIVARNFYRPRSAEVMAKHAKLFPLIETITIADLGGWMQAQKTLFSEGGTFDNAYRR